MQLLLTKGKVEKRVPEVAQVSRRFRPQHMEDGTQLLVAASYRACSPQLEECVDLVLVPSR